MATNGEDGSVLDKGIWPYPLIPVLLYDYFKQKFFVLPPKGLMDPSS